MAGAFSSFEIFVKYIANSVIAASSSRFSKECVDSSERLGIASVNSSTASSTAFASSATTISSTVSSTASVTCSLIVGSIEIWASFFPRPKNPFFPSSNTSIVTSSLVKPSACKPFCVASSIVFPS